MRRIVLGTAGHVDHGKTSLVRALTGVDCDRWQEEKDRGITIDLGFAVLKEGDLQIGFVDVPGHERFLHNALAGLGGIRMMLLVVAADEGIMPQTREHLGICSLLGIPGGLVALTKTDLVEEDLVELAQLELEELLADTPFAEAPILPVSSQTGEGVEAFKTRLLELAEQYEAAPDPDRPVRLPIDRAFHLKGLGVVVTGTLVSGSVHPGDELALLPGEETVRVRSVQVHGEDREEASTGERTSMQISGVELEDVTRGQQIATPDRFLTSNRLLARIRLLPECPVEIDAWTPIRLHLFSAQVMGEMRPLDVEAFGPGEETVVELRLAAPVATVRGDRIVVTRPSPATTLGGGTLLDPLWRRQRGSLLQKALEDLRGSDDDALRFWIRDAGDKGRSAHDLALRLGERSERIVPRLEAMTGDGKLLEIPEGHGHARRWIVPRAYARVKKRAQRVLETYFEKDRLALGIPKAEAIRRILPGRASELAGVYFPWLEKEGVLAVEGDVVNLPGREVELSDEESSLEKDILERYHQAGLQPPAPSDVTIGLSAKPQIVEGVIRHLTDRGDLVRLPGGLLIAQSALDQLRQDLRDEGWDQFDVGQFKDRFDLSRKWAIPLLEHLDSTNVTRRIGDKRMLVS